MAITEVTTIEELASVSATDDDFEETAYSQSLQHQNRERIAALRGCLKRVTGLRIMMSFRLAMSGISMDDRREMQLSKIHEHLYTGVDLALAEAERCIMCMIAARETF